MRTAAFLLVVIAGTTGGLAQDLPDSLPRQPFHLTARPWKPLNIPREAYLDAIEGICRFTIQHQDAGGAVVDPFLHREHQYSTPYFAFAVGALIHAGRAPDLLDHGVRAMDHATRCFAKGSAGIPDQHGEFFIPALTGALELYKDHVPAEKMAVWRQRMNTPIEQLVRGPTNNWRTYAMRGQWMRSKLGLADHDKAVSFIEDAWLNVTQRQRIAQDKWNLYQDHQTDPESHAVEAVGRGNLLGLIAQGYDGKSSREIQKLVERGTAVSLLLQDPSGQCPPDGRTDDHVFNDVLYQLCFEAMAERAGQGGDAWLAGQYRHSAMLSFQSIQRWRRGDGAWAGSYFVTKNRFDPAARVGYQPASNYGNYNGAVMLHLAEAYLARATDIPERPAPVEIGGYALATDPRFASVVANAGGMQLFAALRGDTQKVYDQYWTALGVERFGRVNWDTRLGPSDGIRDGKSGRGVSFAPTWIEGGRWVRMADVPERYRGSFSVQFAHPLLVRCAIDYKPIKGSGPAFRHEFVLTPDGVLATLRSDDAKEFAVTWPVLENDGLALKPVISDVAASTAYSDDADEQNYLALDPGTRVSGEEEPVRSTYGWLRPVRATAVAGINRTFVYPRGPQDPPARKVRDSFHAAADGFESQLGVVHGTLYVGRTSAGGEGRSIDCDRDGKPDAVFDADCRFVLQLREGRVVAVEADRELTVRVQGKQIRLSAYTPVTIDEK
ncbi:MAG: hypothetical protein ACHRHE_06155 [Tepidisphaerales bacterium]